MILTDEQIAETVKSRYPGRKHTFEDSYRTEEDIRVRERVAYTEGAKDSREYHRELIEAGMKWQKLMKVVKSLKNDKDEEDYWTNEEIDLIGEEALKIADIL